MAEVLDYPPVRAEGAFQAPQRFGRKRGFWETEHVGCHQPQLNNNKRTRGDAAAGAAEGASTRGVGRGERQHASLDHGAAAGPASSDSLRQQLQECQVLLQNAVRENGILKKAVAIQNDREAAMHKEREDCARAVVQMRGTIRQLEIDNYALRAHLRSQMGPDSTHTSGGPRHIF